MKSIIKNFVAKLTSFWWKSLSWIIRQIAVFSFKRLNRKKRDPVKEKITKQKLPKLSKQEEELKNQLQKEIDEKLKALDES